MPQQPIHWVFFSSKNAVKFFFGQETYNSTYKYAAIAPETAGELSKHVPNIHFIGNETNTNAAAKEFRSMLKPLEIVLFPQALAGKRTVQKHLPNKQVIDLAVYKTTDHYPLKSHQTSAILFTSPSNVIAYFKQNGVLSGQKYLAIGQTTGAELRQMGISPLVANGYGESALAQLVISALTPST